MASPGELLERLRFALEVTLGMARAGGAVSLASASLHMLSGSERVLEGGAMRAASGSGGGAAPPGAASVEAGAAAAREAIVGGGGGPAVAVRSTVPSALGKTHRLRFSS